MAIYYVSNVNSNGYALGVDTNNGTAKATPFLTITKAASVMASGDVINVNPTATPYQTSGGGFPNWLNIAVNVTIQTDQSLLGTGRAIWQTANGSADRFLQFQQAFTSVTVSDFIFDGQNSATLTTGITVQSSTSGPVSIIRCQFKNMSSANYVIDNSSSASGLILTVDRCTANLSDSIQSTAQFLIQRGDSVGSFTSTVNILGCTVSGIRYAYNFAGSHGWAPALNIQAASDGTRNTFTAFNSRVVIFSASQANTTTQLFAESDVTGMSNAAVSDSGAFTINNLTVRNCTFTGVYDCVSIGNTITALNVLGTITTGACKFINCTGTITALFANGLNYSATGTGYFLYVNGAAVTKARIENSVFTGTGYVLFGNNNTLLDCLVSNCRILSNTSGGNPISLANGSAGFRCVGSYFGGNSAAAIYLNGATSGVIVDSCTLIGKYSLVRALGINMTGVTVTNNRIYQTGSADDGISIYGGTNINVSGNTFCTDMTTGHGILIGMDGLVTKASNSTQSTNVNLGDVSGNTYVAQPFTTGGSADVQNSQQLASVYLNLKKAGSPAGNVTVSIYSNNAGSPGTLISTSDFVLAANRLTGASQTFEFFFYTRPTTLYATQYWIGVTYSGSVNGTDYVVLDSNTSGATAKTSANGTSWSTNSNALIYSALYGSYETVNPVVKNNIIRVTNQAGNCHGVIIGAVSGGRVEGNQVYGGGPMLIAKQVDGTVTACVFCNNLVYEDRGYQQGLRSKGSRSVKFYHNTIVINGSAGNALMIDDAGVSPNFNGQPSVNVAAKNNVIIANYPQGGGVVYYLGSTFATPNATGTVINGNCVYSVQGVAHLMSDYSSGSLVNYDTVSALNIAGYDQAGLTSNPQLVGGLSMAKLSDFIPSLSTPATGAGLNVFADVAADAQGFPQTTTPTLGALQPVRRVGLRQPV